jgi:hypothetical protein
MIKKLPIYGIGLPTFDFIDAKRLWKYECKLCKHSQNEACQQNYQCKRELHYILFKKQN